MDKRKPINVMGFMEFVMNISITYSNIKKLKQVAELISEQVKDMDKNIYFC